MSEGHCNVACESRQQDLRNAMAQQYGPLLTGPQLVQALGYRNAAALRQARRQKRIGVPVFAAPSRKGLCALTSDVADWLHSISVSSSKEGVM